MSNSKGMNRLIDCLMPFLLIAQRPVGQCFFKAFKYARFVRVESSNVYVELEEFFADMWTNFFRIHKTLLTPAYSALMNHDAEKFFY